MYGYDPVQLDAHITGNYGEDAFKGGTCLYDDCAVYDCCPYDHDRYECETVSDDTEADRRHDAMMED